MSDDGATGVQPLTDGEEKLLRALARVVITVPRAFEADLMREEGMPLAEYFALVHLSEAPSRRLRMGDLAAASGLTLSGTTRVVGRLEEQGYAQRQKCATDGRGHEAVLTDAGLRQLKKAWPAHLRSVRRHVFDRLGEVDIDAVAQALDALIGPTPPAHDG
jgi:DNA-binding MarR family transcriptional regulator